MIRIDIEKKLKAYGGEQWLKVNRNFEPGTIIKIQGPSGAGKTTFLKILAGLIKPEIGLIKVEDETWLDTKSNTNLSPQKRKTGFVFQDYALFPNMTVREHLAYATTDQQWTNRLLHLGKLEALSNHKPIHLSGGQQQRLAILRALAIKPRLILMDEPFSALDKSTKIALTNRLQQLFTELGSTVFIVSHNLDELKAFDGEVMEIDTEN